ncbi:DUF3106 domain-containing protein [Lysobacter sp. GX 14042]|uniref:DUF3106 domain-containing protein n=1 Tax=Lysobacter sp. GX 14042 TaxID=2907155 RepID=UPI001F1E0823|nr:DUF3106 domain-containing protein [Lysobacter sp. GX 14042]MCE7032109.1 DUF3106 domain-containing protein [Lysobacter sp. GX 14042]
MSRTDRRRRWGLLPALLVAGAAAAVPPGLEELADAWDSLDPGRRQQLQERAATWERWDSVAQEAFLGRMTGWDALDREERAAGRVRYQAWRELPNYDRARVRAAASGYAQLPPDEQQALRGEFDALDASERRGWLLGPELGADYPALQPLLAQVPGDEHDALLDALRGLDSRQRGDLAVLVQRTAPQDRDQLRRELVSTAAESRGQWLRTRLGR